MLQSLGLQRVRHLVELVNNNSEVHLFSSKSKKGFKQLGCRMKLGLQRKHTESGHYEKKPALPRGEGTEAAEEHSLVHKWPSTSQHLSDYITCSPGPLQHMTSNSELFSDPSPKTQKREEREILRIFLCLSGEFF